MIMWYPNFVLTGGSVYTGLSVLLTGKANAASWKGPTMEPLVIQPKSPWKKEPSGLGFENITATAALSAGRVGDAAVGQETCPGGTCLGSVHRCEGGQRAEEELLMGGLPLSKHWLAKATAGSGSALPECWPAAVWGSCAPAPLQRSVYG